jgi:hypothetical protein
VCVAHTDRPLSVFISHKSSGELVLLRSSSLTSVLNIQRVRNVQDIQSLSVYFSASFSTWQALGQNERTGVKRGSTNRDHCFGAVGDRDAAPTSLIRLQPVIALTRAQSNLSNKEITTNAWTNQESGYLGRVARSHGVMCRDLPAECVFRLCATDTDLEPTKLRVPPTKYKSPDPQLDYQPRQEYSLSYILPGDRAMPCR